MVLIFSIGMAIISFLYYGLLRKLNDKWKEIFQFTIMYLFMYLVFQIGWYIFERHVIDPQYWSHDSYVGSVKGISLFFFLSTFIVAYLMYPFKHIRRSKVLIWGLLIISLLVIGVVTLFEVAHAFSDM
jgi:hypothetical protein